MTKYFMALTCLALLGGWPASRAFCQGDPAASQTPEEIAASATNFLATLTEDQRNKVVYDFKNDEQRRRWSNLPTTFVRRGGLRMGDLTQPQRAAAMAVVAAALSSQGYQKVTEIVQGDEMLKRNEGGGPGGPGGPAMFGRDEYYISFLGQPSPATPWMIQFGGHHLGINITLAGTNATIAPSHTGSQPATYELEGRTIRPLGREVDKAFALLSSLDEAQSKQAILGFQMHDLVLGPGRDGRTIEPEGIKGSALNDRQRAALADLAGEWIGIMSDGVARMKMEEVKRHLEDTWFSWSGPKEKGKGYFRIQGPTVYIEYAPQTLGGDVTQHIHTIYRDPENDYGVKWWKP
jgi:hypothetical protein